MTRRYWQVNSQIIDVGRQLTQSQIIAMLVSTLRLLKIDGPVPHE